jgi:hypothetical protein
MFVFYILVDNLSFKVGASNWSWSCTIGLSAPIWCDKADLE